MNKKYLKFYDSCDNCAAFTPLTHEYLKNELGINIEQITLEKINKNNFFCGCLLEFDQKWDAWGKAKPSEPCPKPKTKKELLFYAGYYE